MEYASEAPEYIIMYPDVHSYTMNVMMMIVFFLACEDFGGRFDDSFPVWAFFFFLFFFNKWRSAHVHINSTFFMPGSIHSGLAN